MRLTIPGTRSQVKTIYSAPKDLTLEAFKWDMDVDEEDTIFPEDEEPEYQEPKEIYIETTVDNSASGWMYFKALYLTMSEVIKSVEASKKLYPNVEVKYGLTKFCDEYDGYYGDYIVTFENDNFFTYDGEEYLEELRKIRFSGGNSDGYENLNVGISYSVDKLEAHTPKKAKRVLLSFSDSCERPGNRKHDFTLQGRNGIHAALIFCKEDDKGIYEPEFRKPDGMETLTHVLSIDKFVAKHAQMGERYIVNTIMRMIKQVGETDE